MRLTLPNGETITHVSLMRPDRKLLAGCDSGKFWDLGFMLLFCLFVFHTLASVIFAVIVGGVGYPLLYWIGSKQPFFFPIYNRAYNQQGVYRRSSRASTSRRAPRADKRSPW